MNIPETLKLGGHIYKVVYTTDQDILDGASGAMSDQDCTIWIDPRFPKSIQESTLIHEMLHAFCATMGDSEYGHSLIDSLAEQLYQGLKDNNLLR